MQSKYDRRLSAEYQRDCADMVRREVYLCISQLVSDIAGKDDYDGDWLFKAFDADYAREMVEFEAAKYPDDYDELADLDLSDDDDLREAMDLVGVDYCDAEREVLEHWAISPWLADKLERRGELVVRDWHGLTVWCRCTSGRAISIDSVIEDIFDETFQGKQYA